MSLQLEGALREPVIRWLMQRGLNPIFESYLCGGMCDVVGIEWAPRVGRLIPKLVSMHAVELKLEDAAGVLRQASNNRNVCDFSWAAMPLERVKRMRADTRAKFTEAGVGLLAINSDVEIVVSAAHNTTPERTAFNWNPRRWWRRRNEFLKRCPVHGGNDHGKGT